MTRITFSRPLPRAALVALTLFACQAAQQAMAEATINFSGTLINAPGCTVNLNNRVDVDFGDDVVTYQVDGENYKKQIPYTLNCASLAQQGLTMTLNGNATGFDTSLFKTDNTGLGIRILDEGGKTISPGAFIGFNYNNQPKLYAVPVAKDAATLSTGHFEGTATMVIAYQ